MGPNVSTSAHVGVVSFANELCFNYSRSVALQINHQNLGNQLVSGKKSGRFALIIMNSDGDAS